MPRHKVKSGSRRGTPKLKVLRGGFVPIEISDEMVDLLLVTHGTKEAYIGCARSNGRRCRKEKGTHGACAMCQAFVEAANKLRLLSHCPHWTPSGFAQ